MKLKEHKPLSEKIQAIHIMVFKTMFFLDRLDVFFSPHVKGHKSDLQPKFKKKKSVAWIKLAN